MEEEYKDKNYVHSFSQLYTIKGIPFCFKRKQFNRIPRWDTNIQDYRKRIKLS